MTRWSVSFYGKTQQGSFSCALVYPDAAGEYETRGEAIDHAQTFCGAGQPIVEVKEFISRNRGLKDFMEPFKTIYEIVQDNVAYMADDGNYKEHREAMAAYMVNTLDTMAEQGIKGYREYALETFLRLAK